MPLFLSRFDNQPKFYWDQPKISLLLGSVRFRQGLLLGRIEVLRSSIRRAGDGKAAPGMDQRILTEERLLEWHGGSWRNAVPAGIRAVHTSTPQVPVLRLEIRKFLNWFNADGEIDQVLKAAIAHYWFMVIAPFDQGNKAIAILIADLQLCRADGRDIRHYNVCGQLQELGGLAETTPNRHGETDITVWLEYFLEGMSRALSLAEESTAPQVKKARLTDRYSGLPLNERQQSIIQRLLEDGSGAGDREQNEIPTSGSVLRRISTSQWATLVGCSQDTALRDIQDLMDRNILAREAAGGRSTQYIIKERMS